MGSRTLLLVLGLHFTLLGNIEARVCGLGFTAKGQQCDDTDECKEWDNTSPCGSNAACFNTWGSFYCHCLPGFRSTTTFKFTPFAGECKDLNECLENPPVCGSNTICLNTIGSFNCQCQPGFRVTDTGHCADIDECNEIAGICGVGGDCQNQIGSYSCLCHPGYSNYDNKQAQCSVLTCDQFKANETPGQVSFTVPGPEVSLYSS
ncbi:adhesion G protein-coupled receptor E2-like isoform X1 [Oncorhynchus masou masou]|uniref:adhesion G protein-coupled receptor E2-like isoform X1 n=1 Tax=Oncorhynchus masou masou TaxID=90313 RepID=UPI0031842C3D